MNCMFTTDRTRADVQAIDSKVKVSHLRGNQKPLNQYGPDWLLQHAKTTLEICILVSGVISVL